MEQLDGNSFSISTGFKPKKSGGKKDMKMYLIIGGIAVALVAMLIVSAYKGAAKNKGGTASSESSDSSTISETSDTSSDENSESDSDYEDSFSDTSESAENSDTSELTDEPPDDVSEPNTNTGGATRNGYTTGGYRTTPSKSDEGESGTYTISFNANGGEGTLDSITVESGQYVVLPSAESATKFISKKGYKLIGFSDNTEIAYPLYDYKMPCEDVIMFAVWEPDVFTVTYNSNGGTGSLSRAEVRYGAEIPLPTDVSIYKDGLVLSGWAKTTDAKKPLKSLKMSAENITLYAVWSEKAKTAKLTLHYDDKIQVVEKEIGSIVNMLDNFGVSKDGYSIEGWYFENSPERIENLRIDGDCDVYARWKSAEYITIMIDRSYLNQSADEYTIPLDMTGSATLKLPKVDDKKDVYNHVEGCTYGYSDSPQTGEFGTIKYFGDTEYKFTENVTLYRVLNEYGGGTGTRENPYIISYYDQLLRLSENKASGYFVQTADIKFPSDVKRKPIDTKKISRGYENKSYDFFVYDGGDFTIKGLRGNGGLFGNIAGSTIKNITIDGANIGAENYENVGILCNEISSYSFNGETGKTFGTGNSQIKNCVVKNGKIDGEKATNVGGICGYGGNISDCYVSEIAIKGGENVGGIVGNACTVTGSLSNGVTVSGEIKSAGGIAGTAYGTKICDGDKTCYSGGNIIGCGSRTFVSYAENSGGILGTATAHEKSAFIKSCYAANIYLNGKNNGGIAGADGEFSPHRIAYCLVDNANGYAAVGGENVRSVSKTIVLSVPANSGLTVDGVLSVLNSAGSGYSNWTRFDNKNGGYPYPSKIKF